jgi:ribonuclease P protein component
VTLKKRSEFLRAAGEGQSWGTRGLVLQMRRRDTREQMTIDAAAIRIGLTATRKVGNAVTRNRVRRRLRALAHLLLPEHGQAGCDYVLIGRAETAARPHGLLCGDMMTALGHLHEGRGRSPRPRPSRGGTRVGAR